MIFQGKILPIESTDVPSGHLGLFAGPYNYFYVKDDNGNMYPLLSGLTGPQGPIGFQGPQGLNNILIAENGLTMSSNIVKLGGELIQNTTIDGNFDLTFDNNTTLVESNIFKVSNTTKGFNFNQIGFNNSILDIIYETDNKTLVVGGFTAYNGLTCSQGILKLNSDGTIDTTFNSGIGFDGGIRKVIKQIDGKYLIAGYFTTYNGTPCNRGIVRLNTDGTIDNTFSGGGVPLDPSQYISDIVILPDMKILVGGEFTIFNSTSVGYFARLNSNGSIDNTFNNGTAFDSAVTKIYLTSNNKIFVGGRFTSYNGSDVPDLLAKLKYNGEIDNSFNPGGLGFNTPLVGSTILSILETPDGKLLVGGNHFTQHNGSACPNRFVRLTQDGILDTTFNFGGAGFNNQVWDIKVLSDGKILVSGYFTQYNGLPCNTNIVRLNSNGLVDSTFNSGGIGISSIGSGSRVFVNQEDGKILIGGVGINSYNNINIPQNLFRLNSDGTLEDIINVEVFIDENNGVLRYEDNYKGYFTQRSLVDREYVDTKSYGYNSNNFKGGHHQYNTYNDVLYISNELRKSGMEATTETSIRYDQKYIYSNLNKYEIITHNNKIFLLMENVLATPNTLQVLDSNTLQVLNTTPFGAPNDFISPFRYAGKYKDKIYFGLNDSKVAYIDTNTYTVSSFISIGSNTTSYKIHNGKLFCMCQGSNEVHIIDLDTWAVVQIITGVVSARGCDIAEKENKLYIYSATSGIIKVYNLYDYSFLVNISFLPTFTSPIQVRGETQLGYFDGKIYFLGRSSNDVRVIDCTTDTIISTISVGTQPIVGYIVSNKLFVLNYTSNSLSIVDMNTNSVINTINFSGYGLALPQAGNDNMIYFSNRLIISFQGNSVNDGGLAVINTITNSLIFTQKGYMFRPIQVDYNYNIFAAGGGSYLVKFNFINSDTYVLQPDLITWSKETPIIRYGDTLLNTIGYENNDLVKKQLTKKTIPSLGVLEDYIEEVMIYKNSNYREIKTITSNYTVKDGDYMINADATGGNIVITIPTAVGRRMKEFVFLKVDSSVNTVTISSPVNINGALTKVITTQYDGVTIKSNGIQYYIKK
jgi:uncharacterized delta-60 repeat protein